MKTTSFGAVAAALLFAVSSGTAVSAATTRADEILDRFLNANAHRDNVMIVAHRGAAFANGIEVVAENSLASLKRAVDLGVDMVEVDVRKTSDGVYVISHDSTLDRATTCSGAVSATSFADLRSCKLVYGDDRAVTEETIPTLEEYLDAAKGKIMINLDSKLGIEDAEGIFDVVRDAGMVDYSVATIGAHTPEDVAGAVYVQTLLPDVQLMPNVYDSQISGFEQLPLIYDSLDFDVMQVRNEWRGGPITEDGGILFSDEALALAYENDVHLWINTLGDDNMRGGGRGDAYARDTGDLDAVYGFWARTGATMYQTDEPEMAIEWLEANGYRTGYAPIGAVPLPAGGLLLITAVGAVAAVRRRG